MTSTNIARAKNPDLRASLAAMQRAAQMARDVAMQTNTAIILMQDGKIVRITAAELRRQAKAARSTAGAERANATTLRKSSSARVGTATKKSS